MSVCVTIVSSTVVHSRRTVELLEGRTLNRLEEGTRVTLVHVSLPDAPTAGRHERGWLSILAECRDELERARSQALS